MCVCVVCVCVVCVCGVCVSLCVCVSPCVHAPLTTIIVPHMMFAVSPVLQ